MWEHIKDMFYFSRGEKNGIMVLLFVLIVAFSLPYVSDAFINDSLVINEEFQANIDSFKKSLEEIEKPEYNNRLNQYIIERYDSIELFHFDPNKTNRQQFKQLGLTNKQINTILNYRKKGGRFDEKDDFRKIYGIRYRQYQILKPYILLPEKQRFKKDKRKTENFKRETLFLFDPNTASIDELKRLGLSEKQAQVVVKYRSKGAVFRSKKDFRKIYTISESLHDKLEPYIFIKQTDDNKKENNTTDAKQSDNQKVDLNTATVEELVKIRGIGNFTAKIIVEYRAKLGGFISVNQLKEIRKLHKENFEKYKNELQIKNHAIRKLSLNFADTRELVKHPYLKYAQAKKIVDYRTKNGAYTSIQQLLDNKIIEPDIYKKIKPYLKLN